MRRATEKRVGDVNAIRAYMNKLSADFTPSLERIRHVADGVMTILANFIGMRLKKRVSQV